MWMNDNENNFTYMSGHHRKQQDWKDLSLFDLGHNRPDYPSFILLEQERSVIVFSISMITMWIFASFPLSFHFTCLTHAPPGVHVVTSEWKG